MELNFDKHSLIINKIPTFIKSASLHYFRLPGEKTIKDRLRKLKACGYNTVDLYFCANYHSEKEGVWDFSGNKDVSNILSLIKDLGLFVIARPGPFINAEIAAGGLPFWLIAKKDIIPRHRQNGDYIYSQEYMEFVKEWYSQIIPILNKFDNIIAFQIENEYSTNALEADYMQALYDMARDMGVKAPIFHNDAYCAGLYADILDIYACDIYPYYSPEQNWRQDNFCFDTLDNLEGNIRLYKQDAPLFIAELQAGWFDKWCSNFGYSKMRHVLSDEHINIVTKTALSQGVTMFNHYMGAGGTSFWDMACDEVYSSYDFCAPIAENGIPQANYYKIKEINYFLDGFDFTRTEACDMPFSLPMIEGLWAKARKDIVNNCKWLFVRNLTVAPQNINTSYFDFSLDSFDMKILPINLSLSACDIEFSSLSILGRVKNQEKETILIQLDENNSIQIANYEKMLSKTAKKAPKNIEIDTKNGKIIIKINDIFEDNFSQISFEKNGKITELLFINKETSDKMWILDNKLIFGADFIWPNKNELAIAKSTVISYYNLVDWVQKNIEFDEKKPHFEITDFKSYYCAKEIDIPYALASEDLGWKVCESTDSFANQIYNEFIWYKTTFEGTMDEFEICAKHCFAVYLNGEQIFEHNSYCYEHLFEKEEYIQIAPNRRYFKDRNELTILIQNLGFDKGFSNDTTLPRGLLSFKTKPHKDLRWKIKGGIPSSIQGLKIGDSEEALNKYMQYVEIDFTFHKKMAYSPLYLSFEHAPFNRATVYLNGQKIGRYIKTLGPQNKFYLMDSFIQKENKLALVIWLKSRENQRNNPQKFTMQNLNIELGSFKNFHCVEIY